MDKILVITGNKNEIYKKIKFHFPIVFRLVIDNEGLMLGIICKKFNGNFDDAMYSAKDISRLMFTIFPDASNIQSIIGITNEDGKYQFNISSNFHHIFEVSEREYLNIFGV